MLPFIELRFAPPTLAPDLQVLYADDYQRCLSAKQHACEAQAQAGAVLAQQHRLGWEAGREQAAIEQATLIHQTRLRCDAYFRQAEQQLIEVVRQGVRKVLGHYPDIELTIAAVRQALAQAVQQNDLVLRVRPDQLAQVREQLQGLLQPFAGTGPVQLQADARLAQGGCVLETAMGIIDASIEGQLAALHRALTQREGSDAA